MKGTLIVFEGPDGSGTTRHTAFLSERLRREGKPVTATAEPTKGPIGQLIRTMLKAESLPSADTLQLLFCADRAGHVDTVIRPALSRGEVVISDRYTLSTVIYGTALGLDASWLSAINANFPKPDITVIALPPFEICRERMGRRASLDRFENDDLQRVVYDAYKNIEAEHTVFIDTSGPKESTAEKVYSELLAKGIL